MSRESRRPIDNFLESYRSGSDRLQESIRPLREAPGEFMPVGPGKNAGDASGKMAYEPGTPGGESKGTRTGGGVAQGFSKGDVKAGAPWDTNQYDHARHASMNTCRDCGAKNTVFGEAESFKCYECGNVGPMKTRASEAFARSYNRDRSDMHRMVSEAADVASGQCHDESEDDDEEDPRMKPGWNSPPQDEEMDEAYGDGASSISAGGDMDNRGQGAPGGATSKDEADEDDEDESAPRMRAQFKCAKCGEKAVVPHHGLAEVEDEDEAVSPVTAKCSKGHTSKIAPPHGFKFVTGSARESVRTFFAKYYRESNRANYMP